MCAASFPAGYQMIETSCPNNDISRLVVLGIGIGEQRMTRRTRATSDCHTDLEVYSKCAGVCVCRIWKFDKMVQTGRTGLANRSKGARKVEKQVQLVRKRPYFLVL